MKIYYPLYRELGPISWSAINFMKSVIFIEFILLPFSRIYDIVSNNFIYSTEKPLRMDFRH